MNIADFTFQTRQIVPTFFETLLTASNGNKFGVIYRSVQPAPDASIFEAFKQNPKAFFIEVEVVSIEESPSLESQNILK